MAGDNLFWNQLLMRSDNIVDINANAPDAVEQVRAQLNTISEQFDRVFDPADQFEEYVAVALCQALQRALTPKVAAPVCKVAVQKPPVSTAAKPSALQNAANAKTARKAKKASAQKSPSTKDNATPRK